MPRAQTSLSIIGLLGAGIVAFVWLLSGNPGTDRSLATPSAGSVDAGPEAQPRPEPSVRQAFEQALPDSLINASASPAIRPSKPKPAVPPTGTAGVAGRVVDEKGEPIAACAVYVLREAHAGEEDLARLIERSKRQGFDPRSMGALRVQTGADGRFSFDRLPGATALLLCAAPGGHVFVRSSVFVLGATEQRSIPDLMALRAGRIEVHFTTAENSARSTFIYRVELELVEALNAALTRRSVAFDFAGVATFQHVTPGTWNVSVVQRHEPLGVVARRTITVTAGETAEIALKLPR